ncbi:MAG: GNAT family N-acetyltransferase [Nannocystaceae bacterium]|nr:GNAT family N-acetyltransferase [Nannocystaceae bacterium]
MLKKLIEKLQDGQRRHQERGTPLGLQYVIADGISFVNPAHWDAVADGQTIFLSRAYLAVLDAHSPSNTVQRYAVIYQGTKPVGIVACQIAEISGAQLAPSEDDSHPKTKVLGTLRERVLVCGNLVSSGLHGVAFAEGLDDELGWRAVAEVLYRIRRGEKLGGTIDFVMVKDLKGEQFAHSEVLRRYSYRAIQSDPDMVLELEKPCSTFADYLALLTSKYRSKIKKLGTTLDKAGFVIETLDDLQPVQSELHRLYLEVESRAPVRLATISPGYFSAMRNALGDKFVCSVIRRDHAIVGFVTTVIDRSEAVGYYVGVDYEVNAQYPIYLRLLQLIIADGVAQGCRKISFGRTALEPKANLGAKPVDAHVWMRHRVPALNFLLRKLFAVVPYDEAPQRSPMKKR